MTFEKKATVGGILRSMDERLKLKNDNIKIFKRIIRQIKTKIRDAREAYFNVLEIKEFKKNLETFNIKK